MVRSKVKCEYIQDDYARRTTYRKRSKIVTKKAEELSILGDVDTCAIVYGPYSSRPQVWPSQMEAHRVIARYKSMPEYSRRLLVENQASLTKSRIKKLEENLAKMRSANRLKNLTLSMYACLRGEGASNPNGDDLHDMVGVIEENIDTIRVWKEARKVEGTSRDAEIEVSPYQGELSAQGLEVLAYQGEPSPQGQEIVNEMAKEISDEEVEMIPGMWGGAFPHGAELLSGMMKKNLSLASDLSR